MSVLQSRASHRTVAVEDLYPLGMGAHCLGGQAAVNYKDGQAFPAPCLFCFVEALSPVTQVGLKLDSEAENLLELLIPLISLLRAGFTGMRHHARSVCC